METIQCSTCEGTTKMTFTVTEVVDGKEVVSKPKLDCMRCNATGQIPLEQLIQEEEEKEIWCECDEDHGVNFHDDGNTQEYPHGYTCHKHHYSCIGCGLIVQIG